MFFRSLNIIQKNFDRLLFSKFMELINFKD